MKLITEFKDTDIETSISESVDKDGNKQVFIEGIFMQAEKVNRNGRVYRKPIMEKAVNTYIEDFVKKGRAFGELNHPEGPSVNLDKVSHRITDLRMEGNDVMGKALITNTPMGNIVKGLIESGGKLGVSSRGLGNIIKSEGHSYVSDDFVLTTVDIVHDPSAQDAFVNGIMEGVDWTYKNGVITPEQVEKYETEVKTAKRENLASIQEAVFRDFLSRL